MPNKPSVKKAYIGHFSEAPGHSTGNRFIRTGYRINFASAKAIFKTIFMIHNESINIWSHLLGALFFVLLAWSVGDIQDFSSQIVPWINPYYNNSIIQEMLHDHYSAAINAFDTIYADTPTKSQQIEELGDAYNSLAESSSWDRFQEMFRKTKNLLQDSINNLSLVATKTTDALQIEEMKKKVQSLLGVLDSEEFSWVDMYNPYQGQEVIMEVARWPIFVFIICAIICLGCSTVYHVFHEISANVSAFLSRLDYAGVSLLIAGSCYPPVYYIFYCEPLFTTIFLFGITIISIIVFVATLQPGFHSAKYQTVRGLLYLALGLTAATPFLRFLIHYDRVAAFMSCIPYFAMMGVCYVGGVLIYIWKIPERWAPGYFDIYGQSHQIWHFMVLSAALFHYLGVMDSYHKRMITMCPA